MAQSIIGVACHNGQQPWVKEFFELFKTPWEFYEPDGSYSVVISTCGRPSNLQTQLFVEYRGAPTIGSPASVYLECDGGRRIPLYGQATTPVVSTESSPVPTIRAGYDLFREVEFLISRGQPAEHAAIPTLDLHISMLRGWMIAAGIPFVEIPPSPAGYDFTCCLTHDVDFVRITDHKFDHTLFGFVQRASVGSLWNFARGRTSWRHCANNLKALVSLPAVFLGVRDDFWLQDFDRFLDLERETKATFFFIPFKNRAGAKVTRRHSARRAAAYDVRREGKLLNRLKEAGNEIGVHGIDAWHSPEKGREERVRIAETCGEPAFGVRMHWLCFDESSPRMLEEAGFNYDSTCGYNDTVGYRAGTHQVFQPAGARRLLELPLHIQDTALFYPKHAATAGNHAWTACEAVVDNAVSNAGVLTLLWHTRSLSPERQWDEFYRRLLIKLKTYRVWFTTAGNAVNWFRGRRAVSFRSVELPGSWLHISLDGAPLQQGLPNLAIRIHFGDGSFRDKAWTGEPVMEIPFEKCRGRF